MEQLFDKHLFQQSTIHWMFGTFDCCFHIGKAYCFKERISFAGQKDIYRGAFEKRIFFETNDLIMICQTLKITYLYKPSLEINQRIAFIVITIHGKLTRATFVIKKSFKIGAVLTNWCKTALRQVILEKNQLASLLQEIHFGDALLKHSYFKMRCSFGSKAVADFSQTAVFVLPPFLIIFCFILISINSF